MIDDTYSPAIDAVRTSCAIARSVQARLEGIRRLTKDDRSPVTVADFAVQAAVALILRERLGDDLRLVAEERADALRDEANANLCRAVVAAVSESLGPVDPDAVLDAIDSGDDDGRAASYWTLDPIDGTKGFLRGQQYAIALARIDHGAVTFGVMGCPNLPEEPGRSLEEADPDGVIYAAQRDRGAWRVPHAGGYGGTPIHAAATSPPGGLRVCESVEKAHSKQSDTARILETLGVVADPVRLDSQCKYAVVARGQADAYLRLPTRVDYVERIWDHAAGSLLAREAGAVVTDVTGAALEFRHGRGLETNRGVVCAGPMVHGPIVEAIDRLGISAAAR
jgi:3'(2'), 5'-bisphosphate nucleotidase